MIMIIYSWVAILITTLLYTSVAQPPNDQCSGATDVGSWTDGGQSSITVTNQSNIGATDDYWEAPVCVNYPTPGVWFKVSVAFPARIAVSTCNQADFDTVISIYSGASCGSLVCETAGDDSDGCGGGTTRVVDDVLPGNIYILVAGFRRQTGNFDLTVSVTDNSPPNNDQCSAATDLGSFTDGQNLTVTGQSNVGATDDSFEAPPPCFIMPWPGVWYQFSVAFPARIHVYTCNQADFGAQIGIYSGGSCGSLVCESPDDYSTYGCDRGTSRLVDRVMPGTFYILVMGSDSQVGNFNLTVSVTAFSPPMNDQCSGATDLGSLTTDNQTITVTDQSIVDATDDNTPGCTIMPLLCVALFHSSSPQRE